MSTEPIAGLNALLSLCLERGASDLHLSAGAAPVFRIDGRLIPASAAGVDVDALIGALGNSRQQEVFSREQTLDLAYSPPSGERFRLHVFRERGRTAIAVRKLESRFKSFDELCLPSALQELADLRDGLVLVTGPTGSGKSTTLAAQIHHINRTRNCHIITIEDPVEYLHASLSSLVRQRELYTDVPGFAQAVRAAMREDPDVLLIGEMRDLDTARAALTAAETGHLVLSTLHTGDAVGALDRMIGLFPGPEQESVRQQLSMVLRAVVAQRLLPDRRGAGRVPAVEILRVTPAVAHLIRTGKPQQIYSAMELGAADGMQTFDQALAGLLGLGLVEPAAAHPISRDWRLVEGYLHRGGRG